MRLNLVGNGFDLYHGLPSSYYYFGCFLASNYPDFYYEMSQMYDFQCLKRVGHDDFDLVVSDIFWRTFEEHLGYLDFGWMEGRLIDDLGLECDDPVDIDIPETVNSQVIKEKFCEWICTTVNTKENFDIIKSHISSNKCHFRSNDYFVNFNYTQTLEEIYDIPQNRVIHIHGECELNEQWADLVVGHGNEEQIEYLDQIINEIEMDSGWLGYQSDRNRLNEYKCERTILKDLKKDTANLSHRLIRRLQNQNLQVDEIWVWGLSCGPVDEKYIESIHKEFPNATWKFSCYTVAEEIERARFAEKLGLQTTRCFLLNNPNSNALQNMIVKANNITEYESVKSKLIAL